MKKTTDLNIKLLDYNATEFKEGLLKMNEELNIFKDIKQKEKLNNGLTLSAEGVTLIITGINSVVLLINYILLYLSKRRSGIIKIQDSNGKSIEFPRDTPLEKIEQYLNVFSNSGKEIIIYPKL